MEDISRGARSVISFFSKDSAESPGAEGITRSEFLSKTALAAAAIPFGTMIYGIVSGAHDYRIRKQIVKLPNLPKSFDGIKIAQLSDIHSGSFFNKTAVKGGVDMVMNEKPDVIFFTGDLVNNEASEVRDYIDVFNKLKAPLGSSRPAVRGFLASMRQSITRFKVMAKVRAPAPASKISAVIRQDGQLPPAKTAPANKSGRENSVCSILMKRA